LSPASYWDIEGRSPWLIFLSVSQVSLASGFFGLKDGPMLASGVARGSAGAGGPAVSAPLLVVRGEANVGVELVEFSKEQRLWCSVETHDSMVLYGTFQDLNSQDCLNRVLKSCILNPEGFPVMTLASNPETQNGNAGLERETP
jgi:hypothetical protein